MNDDRYIIKIVPNKGDTVHRFEIRKRHVWEAVCVIALMVLTGLGAGVFEIAHARSQVATLREESAQEQTSIKAIDAQTESLRDELHAVQQQNQQIRALIGAPAQPSPKRPPRTQIDGPTSWLPGTSVPAVSEHVAVLEEDAQQLRTESNSMRTLAMRVLNIRHMHEIARAEALAAIPSIDPIPGAEVVGCFCYRTSPDVGFHKGVDLAADYGTIVHAAAAGTVVSAGYEEGGYGVKVDIDHGNGYHTWYAHLSSVSVQPGQHVYKGQVIAASGNSGFSTGPHLHYQLMLNGTPIDPTPFLHGVPSNVLASL